MLLAHVGALFFRGAVRDPYDRKATSDLCVSSRVFQGSSLAAAGSCYQLNMAGKYVVCREIGEVMLSRSRGVGSVGWDLLQGSHELILLQLSFCGDMLRSMGDVSYSVCK